MNEDIPTQYPFVTKNYDEFLKTLQSELYIKILISGDLETSSYNDNFSKTDSAEFKLADNFKPTDYKLSWFTYPVSDEYNTVIDKIKTKMLEDNLVNIDIKDMGTSFLLLVPGAHLQEHIDKGKFRGTNLIFPILGTGTFTYNSGNIRYTIDKPTFVSNTVWHNFLNLTNKLVAILTITMPIDIEQLKDKTLKPAPKMQ